MAHENYNREWRDQNDLTFENGYWVRTVTTLSERIFSVYNDCPAFLFGDLRDAFNKAFCHDSIEECRPLLIYIHHDRNVLDLFSSSDLNEFLLKNYVVWPCDITTYHYREEFKKLWNEIFPQSSGIEFSMNECPMLIGITQQYSSSEYKYHVLLIRDVLLPDGEELGFEPLLFNLIVFKQEFDRNEKRVLRDFMKKTGLCAELILEIVSYLSLPDTIKAFSLSIILFLENCKIKKPLKQPVEEFIKTIMPKIRSNLINSLYLDANQYKKIMASASLDTFKNIERFTLHNFEKLLQVNDMNRYLPNLIYFRTSFDDKVNFHHLCKIVKLIPNSAQQFEIYCGSIPCSHDHVSLFFIKADANTTIKSIKINIDHVSTSLMNNCKQSLPKCILQTIADVIRIMRKIENVGIIVRTGNILAFLDVDIWSTLANKCSELKNINLEMLEKTFEDKRLSEKIEETKSALENIRPTIQFQVKVK